MARNANRPGASGERREEQRPAGDVSPVTVERRSVLQWLGSATVLALGADLLAACSDGGGAAGDGLLLPDRGVPTSGFPFKPGVSGHGVFDGWGERTVDPQDLKQILASWRLRVDGMVDTPLDLGFADVLQLKRQDQVTDLHCVEGWSILDIPWNGVRLATILDRAGVKPAASHVTFHTVNSVYNESLPLAVAREARTLIAYGIAGTTLPLKHGFPLRLVVPRLLGYKSAKYVERIELTERAVKGYWVKLGYGYDAEVPEARLRPGKY